MGVLPQGDDEFGYEDSGERWLPVHTVTTILLVRLPVTGSGMPPPVADGSVLAECALHDLRPQR
jgi:hypothetical protein